MADTVKTKSKEKKYYEAVGRRKTAVARVRLYESSRQSVTINDKTVDEYFPTAELRYIGTEALEEAKASKKFKVSAKVSGGGTTAQSEAVRLGIARALIHFDPDLRKKLKQAGFLKRDPRVVERKKFGLKKARRAAQWSKR